MLIVFYLRLHPFRFGQLHQCLQGISKKVLSTELKQLEADGLVSREQQGQYVRYTLTPLGQTAVPMIEVAAHWGSQFPDESDAPTAVAK
ncbi:winged helix-turn-helix transcriptional regulator [Hymenobacter cellulosivorans]|uniref:Helix-turn-helix transcriptional regulator n=1 Tax=Hymenobacter cellulosivorans TaxID=2932249 RepID=A0ABY4FAY1_9BACT|nr:helix-turn-helix domain-containing protein [Hymenobacter cellulosivorans]UOQ51611.1 helix-turn-helix transcriptional regulator [Hymenobacter cellulosivorans]